MTRKEKIEFIKSIQSGKPIDEIPRAGSMLIIYSLNEDGSKGTVFRIGSAQRQLTKIELDAIIAKERPATTIWLPDKEQ